MRWKTLEFHHGDSTWGYEWRLGGGLGGLVGRDKEEGRQRARIDI